MKLISLIGASALLIPSVAHATGSPHLAGQPEPAFVPAASPAVASPHRPVTLSAAAMAAASPDLVYPPPPLIPVSGAPWTCFNGEVCSATFTNFPQTWNNETQWCFGGFITSGDGPNLNQPYFAAPLQYVYLDGGGEYLRQCDNVYNTAGNGEFLSENADTTNDGDIAIGFEMIAPIIGSDQSPVAVIDPSIAFQYSFLLEGSLDHSYHCSSRLSILVTDMTTNTTVARVDEYPYVASVGAPGWATQQGWTDGSWHEMNSPMSASFTGTVGHEYLVWIWADTENNEDTNDYISVLLQSVQVSWWN